ncbi:MAG: hypothetical protein ACXU82_12860 [Caulobacteraceae bacterium]
MDVLGELQTEFETLGEAMVAERLSANHYQGPARAIAMRWLNEKSLSRLGIDAPAHGTLLDPASQRAIHAERSARMAILCAVVALLVAVGSLGLSVRTLQATQTIRQAVASATPPTATPH